MTYTYCFSLQSISFILSRSIINFRLYLTPFLKLLNFLDSVVESNLRLFDPLHYVKFSCVIRTSVVYNSTYVLICFDISRNIFLTHVSDTVLNLKTAIFCGPLIYSFSSIIQKYLQYFSINDTNFNNESFIKIGLTFVETRNPGRPRSASLIGQHKALMCCNLRFLGRKFLPI